MNIGVPRETKDDEKRVGLLPMGAEMLERAGHTVFIEQGASEGALVLDEDYIEAGAVVVDTAQEVFAEADLIVKVKEPQPEEYGLIREDQVIFTFFHFAASKDLTRSFMDTGAVAIAYETVQDGGGNLPLLVPMSEIAGRMAVQEGAKYLEGPQGGRGVLLSGLPGVAPADVVILGAGVVGKNAALIASGMGASVHLLDIDVGQLRHAEQVLPRNVSTYMSNPYNLEKLVAGADLLIGAVLVPGSKAPILVGEDMLKSMKRKAVILDAAVDQGGCVETMRPTTHSDPIYTVDSIVHCGIANLPGGVPRTATMALCNATLLYILAVADWGWETACQKDVGLAHGLNIIHGNVTHSGVADAVGMQFHPLPFDVHVKA